VANVDWLLFDVGGVLEIVDDDWFLRFTERCAARIGIPHERLQARLDAADLPDSTIRSDVEDRWWRAFGRAVDAGPDALAAIRTDFWNAYCGRPDDLLLGEARALVGRVGLAILSNSADGARREEERRYGFASIFDPIGYSHEIGVEKPDARAFQIMLAAMGSAPERVLFIDDVAENIEAARALGMHAHRHAGDHETLSVIRQALTPD
jgi:putative hydrolase of the HAD superfamily